MTNATPISTIQKMLGRRTVRGYQFRSAIDSFFHHAAEALGVRHPCLIWCDGTQTACVNSKGTVKVANIQDDAAITQATMIKYVGFIIHELLHSKYTDFNVTSDIDFIRSLHNAVEDAYIEHSGINDNLLGNITATLTALIDEMVDQALAANIDWTNPAQYPFALAVYLRRHAVRKVPVALGLKPVFDEAFKRTLLAKSSADTLAIAEWVYNQLPMTSRATSPKLVTKAIKPVNPKLAIKLAMPKAMPLRTARTPLQAPIKDRVRVTPRVTLQTVLMPLMLALQSPSIHAPKQ